MNASRRFLFRASQIRKKQRTDALEIQIDSIGSAFGDALTELPAGMADELFAHFGRELVTATEEEMYGDCAQRLADVIDLFDYDYDLDDDPLLAEDWQVIRDIVSEHALVLDMRLVSYVMSLVVDHGQI